MKSLRLQTIASLVPLNVSIIDIGTDHAYLPIYLYENNISKNITASDISKKVLETSLSNLKKHHLEKEIKLILSDGFLNIEKVFDVAIIAGMGTNTILNICQKAINLPETLIIASNNDYYELRKKMSLLGYKILQEKVVLENNIYYVIIKYVKGKDILSEDEMLFGKSNNLEYFNYLIVYYMDLYKKSKKDIYLEYTKKLKNIIGKIPD